MSKNNKGTAKRKAQKEKAKQKQAAKYGPPPAPLSVIKFDSPEWEALVTGEKGEYWKAAKGIVSSLAKPNQEVLRQNTFEGVEPDEYLAMLRSILTDPEMEDVEAKFERKFGSYAPVPYSEWRDKFHDLWKQTTWKPDMSQLEKSKLWLANYLRAASINCFGTETVPQLPTEVAVELIQRGRNSGWPYMTSKWYNKPEVKSWYLEQAAKLVQGEDTLKGCPHILFKRVQPNGLTPKMRPVECPPKHEAIAARTLTERFIQMFKTLPEFYGFNGNTEVHWALESFMKRKTFVESDFSSFDANCQEILPHVFDVIKAVCPQETHEYIDITLRYYQNAVVVTPEGILYSRSKINGLMSGEGWTSVIGTLANALGVHYTMTKMGFTPRDYDSLSFGDDIAIAVDGEFDVVSFERHMAELGMECNRNKQEVSTGPKARVSFLGFYHFRDRWSQGNRGVYPIMRGAPGLYYREFYLAADKAVKMVEGEEGAEALPDASKRGIDLVAIVSKLNNCAEHKDFRALVELVKSNQRDGLNTDLIMPWEPLLKARLSGRFNRGQGLRSSPVMQLLYELEGRDVNELEDEPDDEITQVDCDWDELDALGIS